MITSSSSLRVSTISFFAFLSSSNDFFTISTRPAAVLYCVFSVSMAFTSPPSALFFSSIGWNCGRYFTRTCWIFWSVSAMCFVHASSSWFFWCSCCFSDAISSSSVSFSMPASSFSLYRSTQSSRIFSSITSFSAAIASRLFASASSFSLITPIICARRASCAALCSSSFFTISSNMPFTLVYAASKPLIIASIVTSSFWILFTRICVAWPLRCRHVWISACFASSSFFSAALRVEISSAFA